MPIFMKNQHPSRYEKKVMAKINEDPNTKMQVMLPTLRRKTKKVRTQVVLTLVVAIKSLVRRTIATVAPDTPCKTAKIPVKNRTSRIVLALLEKLNRSEFKRFAGDLWQKTGLAGLNNNAYEA